MKSKNLFFLFCAVLLLGAVAWCFLYWRWRNPVVMDNQSVGNNEEVEEKNGETEYDFSQDLDASTWETYESEKVGVCIKYPNRWQVIVLEDEKAGFALRSPVYVSIRSGNVFYDGEIYVNDLANPKNLDIKDLFQTFDDGSGLWFSQYGYQDITIKKRKGIYFSEIDGRRENYYLVGDQVIYSFSYEYYENQKESTISDILREIVENFEPLN